MTFTLPLLSFTRPLFPVLAHTLGLANSQRREFNHRRGMWPAFPANALGSMRAWMLAFFHPKRPHHRSVVGCTACGSLNAALPQSLVREEGQMTLEWLVQTDGSVGALILRLTLAVVLFPHGAQKVLGWFGGPGLKATLQYFTSAGIPPVFGLLAIAAEFLGSLGLAVGLLTRIDAALLLATRGSAP
jgi:hypothetical protein